MNRKNEEPEQAFNWRESNASDLSEIGFDSLPKEIKKSIISLIDSVDIMRIRLVNQEWFSLIPFSTFRLGCVLATEIPSLVYCFSRYNRPIGLYFTKGEHIDRESIEQIVKLTQLTSLQFKQAYDVPVESHSLLTALPNLELISGVSIDKNTARQLTNLTSIRTDCVLNISHVLPRLQRLEVCYILNDDDESSVYDSNITALSIIESTTACEQNFLDRFTNLKHLIKETEYSGNSQPVKIKSSVLQSLETDVEVHAESMPDTLTGLTRLSDFSMEMSRISTLTRLQALELHDGGSGLSLTLLTALELLYISFPQQYTVDEIQGLTRLTALSILIDNVQLRCISSLTTLNALTLFGNTEDEISPPPPNLTCLVIGYNLSNRTLELSHLTRLQTLTIERETEKLLSLNGLTRLTFLCAHNRSIDTTLRELTQLIELALPNAAIDVSLLRDMQRLTSLSVSFSGPFDKERWRSAVTRLTSLRKLRVHSDVTAEMVEDLTALKRLNNFQAKMENDRHWSSLTLLTRLQHIPYKAKEPEIVAKLPFFHPNARWNE